MSNFNLKNLWDRIKNSLSVFSHPLDQKKNEHRHAIKIYRELYTHFNLARPVNPTSIQVKYIKNLDAENFIKDIVGNIQYLNIRDLDLKWRWKFTYAEKIADSIQKIILDPESVIKLYEQAIQNNKITIVLGPQQFSCDQVLLVDYKLFMRFKGKQHTFWVSQHFAFYGIYFPAERIYFSLRNHSNSKHKDSIYLFHLEFFKQFEKLWQWNEVNRLYSFSGLLLSYRRPFHYFTDMLTAADVLISSSDIVRQHPKKFIVLIGGSFFLPQRLFGSDCEILYLDIHTLNDYLITNHLFTLQPIKNVAKKFHSFSIDKNFYQKMIARSIESAHQDPKFEKTLEQVEQSSPVLWFSICGEHLQSWAEHHEAILKIVTGFKKNYPKTCVIIDGLTAPEGTPRKQFIDDYARSEEVAFTKIAAQLPDTLIINAIGLKSYEKIALASRIDFFITRFFTDSMYIAQFNSKPGLGYGVATADPIGHRHPMTVILPKIKITDLPFTTDEQNIVHYSIDPDYMADTALKIFERYKELYRSENISDLFSANQECSYTKNIKENSLIITSKFKTPVGICVGEKTDASELECTPSAYPIISSRPYLFRFEAYSNTGSTLQIFAYKDKESVFKSFHFEAGRSRYITFPPEANRFRLFVKLAPFDELEFFDIHWNTYDAVGSVRLAGYLDI